MWWAWAACERDERGPGGADDTARLHSGVAAPALTAGPADAVWGRDALWCRTDAGDPGDWAVDGVAVDTVGGVVPAEQVRAGRVWTCSSPGSEPTTLTPRVAGGNILVVVLDDIGRDRLTAFGGTEAKARTPALDALRDRSVVFDRAWVLPVCSSTRAALYTGRHPERTGIGGLVDKLDPVFLDPAEVSVADALALAERPYDPLLVGKWHLSSLASGPEHPHELGFPRWFGTMSNLDSAFRTDAPGPTGYGRFEWSDDGVLGWVEGYATEQLVTDFERELPGLAEPWLAVVAFNAAHKPWHTPPEEWRRSALEPPDTTSHSVDYMVESMDLALERVLAAVGPDTTVVLLSDNGTVNDVLLPPFEREVGASKGSVAEGGVNVPFLVAGPLVRAPGVSQALVEVTDVFDTLLAVAGLTEADVDSAFGPADRDSVSLLPYLADPDLPSLRRTAYTARFEPNGPGPARALDLRAARDARYKLVRYAADGKLVLEELYDLGGSVVEGPAVDPDESDATRAAFERLSAVLESGESG